MGDPHHFTVSVFLRGADSNWGSVLIPQTVRAYSLTDALHQAAELPLNNWFPTEEEERRCGAGLSGGEKTAPPSDSSSGKSG